MGQRRSKDQRVNRLRLLYRSACDLKLIGVRGEVCSRCSAKGGVYNWEATQVFSYKTQVFYAQKFVFKV